MKASEICQLLAQRVRLLTVAQIAAYFCSENKRPRFAAQRLTRRLQQQGLAEITHCVSAQTFPWTPLCLVPRTQPTALECSALAWKNRQRWSAPVERNTYITPTPECSALFGSVARPVRPYEREHDMAVASFYLALAKNQPHLASSWVPEDAIDAPEFMDHRPDALLAQRASAPLPLTLSA